MYAPSTLTCVEEPLYLRITLHTCRCLLREPFHRLAELLPDIVDVFAGSCILRGTLDFLLKEWQWLLEQ